MERTLVLIKPDAVQRGLIGEIIKRLEQRGLRLIAGKFIQINRDFAEEHYGIHKGKPFYETLLDYIISSPVMAMVWDGLGMSGNFFLKVNTANAAVIQKIMETNIT